MRYIKIADFIIVDYTLTNCIQYTQKWCELRECHHFGFEIV